MTLERLTLRLDALAFGGEAVGRAPDGRVVFVAGGAPGDLVEVLVRARRSRYLRADLERVIEGGPARVTPPCPLADRCGGCPWQQVAPAEQLGWKQRIVERALGGSGACAVVRPIRSAPDGLGYRARARFRRRGGTVGFQERRSHRVIDVDHCPALITDLDRAMQAARHALGPSVGEGGTISGLAAPSGRVHLAVVSGAGSNPVELERAAAALMAGSIAGVIVDGRAHGAIEIDVGPDGPFVASAAGFAQANPAQNQLLRALVLELAEAQGRRVLELYAGDGNFTRDLVQCAAAVTAVEGDAAAAARLAKNLGSAGARRPDIRAQPVAVALQALAREGARFDVVVLDPPRAGADEALELLGRLGAERIVYVSCDPLTLARDLRGLAGFGYRVVVAHPVDMMPHTSHIEVVCQLDRDRGPSGAR